MKKTLKICLAMGGGVSLGTFSGSALTESLKLLLLYGKDKEGKPYRDVIVDGMSGASAGAIAMTILLRCLIDYKSMLSFLGESFSEEDLTKEIADDYFDANVDVANKNPKIEKLKALQVAQKIQYKLWVEEVNSKKLFGNKENINKNGGFGLLDRKLLEKLTRSYLMKVDDFDINNKQLLDNKRVIFACSLTNLLPIEIVSDNNNSTTLEQNLVKSTGSQNHTELRVIDFIFDKEILKEKDTDERWLQFSESPINENSKSNKSKKFDITSKKAWATLSASALACGAFPLAFEPVILKRYKSEFGGNSKNNQWPKSLQKIEDSIEKAKEKYGTKYKTNSFFNESTNNQLKYDSFNFPYIDGGTFNNEPIKEAFKIGTFQDFNNFNDNEERLILFVDPIVREDYNHSFKINSFSPIKGSKNKYKFNSEFSKLLNSTSETVGVLANQGSVKEEHKIRGVKENFKLRNTIFTYLEDNKEIGSSLKPEILITAFDKVDANLNGEFFSLGTRDPLKYFKNEIKKSCKNNTSECLNISSKKLKQLKENIKNVKDINEAYKILEIKKPEDKNIFAQSVFKIIFDFSLNTDGKSENAFRAAILPINEELETINLPGGELQAFAGFASKKSRQYAFEYGRLSALLSLKESKNGFRNGKALIIDSSLDNLKNQIRSNLEELKFFDDNIVYVSQLKELFNLSTERLKNIILQNKWLKYLLFNVPFLATSIFGTLLAPILGVWSMFKSIFKKAPWRGKNLLNDLIQKQSNQVKYLDLTPVTFSIISDEKLTKKLLVGLENQSKIKKIKILENKFTDFNQKSRYQYLFKLYQLEYLDNSRSATSKSSSSMINTFKAPASHIEKLELSLDDKVLIPNIDGNLKPDLKRATIEKNYKNKVVTLRLGRFNFSTLLEDINNEKSSLNYSLKNINYHINPIIEIDINKSNNEWYFKEYTESLDKKILRETL